MINFILILICKNLENANLFLILILICIDLYNTNFNLDLDLRIVKTNVYFDLNMKVLTMNIYKIYRHFFFIKYFSKHKLMMGFFIAVNYPQDPSARQIRSNK